jgi:hypothetical protein
MILPALLILAAFAVYAVASSRRARQRLLARLRDEWGGPRRRKRDMDAISDFFRSHDVGPVSLDDRTWDDLLLDDVFAHLDRTESSVGQQMLYHRLRSAPAPRAMEAFEALIARVTDDVDRREAAQIALARLHDPSGYYVHRLVRPDALDRPAWHVVFPLWSASIIVALLLAPLWPPLILVAPFAFVVNLGLRIATRRQVGSEVVWFRYVGPLLSAAGALADLATAETTALTKSLSSDLSALGRLGAIARWVSRDPLAADPLVYAALELLNQLLLMDASGLYLASRELKSRGPHLLRTIETVGEIDAAVAIASFRVGTRRWTCPSFLPPDAAVVLTDLRHPLIDDAVPNSVTLAPPRGLLVTGSNMSGKSTFLRTVGVNAVLAQTINTCLAATYQAPVYDVRSCLGTRDDLLAGKSYYLVEVESVLSLVRASERVEPRLFLLDELFRGTNAVERIAAAEAVLRALIRGGKPHVALVATHDGELVDLLSDCYTVCHLGDAVGPDGLIFDYHLVPGPATSRNAIALLKLNGAPESLVTQALARAEALDRQRQRTPA